MNRILPPCRWAVLPTAVFVVAITRPAAGEVTGHRGTWNVSRDPHQRIDEAQDFIGLKADCFPDAPSHGQGMDEPVRRNSRKITGIKFTADLGDTRDVDGTNAAVAHRLHQPWSDLSATLPSRSNPPTASLEPAPDNE